MQKNKRKYNFIIRFFISFFVFFVRNFRVLLLEKNKVASIPIKCGLFIILILISIFFIWGGLAPISSSAIAPGMVSYDFKRKTIQHLEGGIIEKILVKEGQKVVINQPLIYLQNTQSKSNNDQYYKELMFLNIKQIRLNAEYNKSFPDFTSILNHSEFIDFIHKTIKTQTILFKSRQELLNDKKIIISQKINQSKNKYEALMMIASSIDKRIKLLNKKLVILEIGCGINPHSLRMNNYPQLNKILIKSTMAKYDNVR